jgi:stage 0 sporulation protein B (sporulation initiation phosphotransferase)
VKLEFEVGQTGSTDRLNDEKLVFLCKEILELLESNVETKAENQLSLIINLSKEHPRFIFDFTGILKETNVLEKWIKNKQINGQNIETELLQKEAFVIHLSVE